MSVLVLLVAVLVLLSVKKVFSRLFDFWTRVGSSYERFGRLTEPRSVRNHEACLLEDEAAERGREGERAVAEELSALDPAKYRVFHDVLLYNIAGRLAQVDHVVISNYRVFVIETKNWRGRIYGHWRSRAWSAYYGGEKYECLNPVRQNSVHSHVVGARLGLPTRLYPRSIVVLPDGTTARVTSTIPVVCLSELVTTIRGYNTEVMTDAERDGCAMELGLQNICSPELRRHHVASLQLRAA